MRGHAEFVREGVRVAVDAAAALKTASVLVLLASLADLKKLDDFFIGAGLHAARDVLGDGFGVGLDLLEKRRELSRLARAGRENFRRVFSFDSEAADLTDAVFTTLYELTTLRH